MSRSPHAAAVATEVVLVLAALLAALLAITGTDRSGPDRLIAAALVVAVLAAIGIRAARQQRVPLGEAPLARSAAAAATAALFTGTTAGGVALAATGVLVLLGSLGVEPLLLRLARQPVPFVAGLPGVRAVPVLPPWGRLTFHGSLAATGLGAMIGLLSAHAGWWLLLCVWAIFPAAALALQGRQRLARARVVGRAIPHAVQRYAPEFIVHTARPDDAGYQVTMWLPYLRRTGRRFIVVTRDELPAAVLADQVQEPVISCRRLADLEAVLGPSVRAVFYVNASSGNGSVVRHRGLRHVYLGHGDSDKPPSYNPTHAMYDLIFAAGPAAVRRYAEHGVVIPAEKFAVVGRPQAEQVTPPARPPAGAEDPVVLYAPTWRGHVSETALSSLPVGEQIVTALLDRGATVIFRPHPFSHEFESDEAVIAAIGRRLEADRRSTGREHLWGAAAETERTVLDCLNASDAMVTDVSSVVSDYLPSGKPFAMIAVPCLPTPFLAAYPVARAAYVVPGELTGLDRTLAAMLGDDPHREQRLAVRADYLAEDRFVAAVQEVLDAPRPSAEAAAESEDGAPLVPRSRVRRLAREGATEVGATLVAAVALGPTLLGLSPGWGEVALLALLIVELGRRSVARVNPTATVATFLPGRVLALVAAASAVLVPAVLTATVSPLVLIVSVAGVLLGGVALAAEVVVRDAWTEPAVVASGLPALGLDTAEPVARSSLLRVWTLALAVSWLLIGVGVFITPLRLLWPVPLLLPVVLALLALIAALRYADRARTAEARVPAALAAAAPEFALYFGSGVGAAYQAGMWLPWLARIGRPFVVVCRTQPMFDELVAALRAAGIDAPVILRPTLRSLEDVVVPTLRAAFYVNNAAKNTHFVERRELTHVWLNHGDSEKPACYNPVHAIYDRIFAAGQAGIDRYARHGVQLPAEKFVVTGRPQVAAINAGPRAEGPPTVLYAPTWQGPYADSRVYSLPQGLQIVQALLDRGATVIFRAHPFNHRFDESRAQVQAVGALLAADAARTGRAHLFGPAAELDLSLEDCFNAADAMITDVSATLSDFLMSGKPYAVVAVGTDPEALVESVPVAAGGYRIDEELTRLPAALDALLDPALDTLGPERERLRRYYLGDRAGGDPAAYADGFLDAARAVVAHQPVGSHA